MLDLILHLKDQMEEIMVPLLAHLFLQLEEEVELHK